MRIAWILIALSFGSCTGHVPTDWNHESEQDTLKVDPPRDPFALPTTPLPEARFSITSPFGGDASVVADSIMSGGFYDENVFTNASREPWNGIQGRWLRFANSNRIVQISVDCRTLPQLGLTDIYLLILPDSVNVTNWMANLNHDVASISQPYKDVPVDTFFVANGSLHVDHAEYSYRIVSIHDEPRHIYQLEYSFGLRNLVFENGLGLPSIYTIRRLCFPGDGWRLTPSG